MWYNPEAEILINLQDPSPTETSKYLSTNIPDLLIKLLHCWLTVATPTKIGDVMYSEQWMAHACFCDILETIPCLTYTLPLIVQQSHMPESNWILVPMLQATLKFYLTAVLGVAWEWGLDL